MKKLTTKKEYRRRRHLRLRQKVQGSVGRPRLCVRMSNRHLSVQIIDDAAAVTLASVSSLAGAVRAEAGGRVNEALAQRMGTLAAEQALSKGVRCVVFDRGGRRYGKRLRALADAARKGGLEF